MFFCLPTLLKFMQDWPGGLYLFIASNPIVPGDRLLMVIGYNYSSRNILVFVYTEGAGITEPGDSYLSHFPGIFLVLFLPRF